MYEEKRSMRDLVHAPEKSYPMMEIWKPMYYVLNSPIC